MTSTVTPYPYDDPRRYESTTVTRFWDLAPAPAESLRFVPGDMTPGTVAGQPTQVIAQHRQNNTSPIALDMTAAIPMSLDDVTAVLWILWDGCCGPLEEITDDPAYMRRMVLETYLAEGGLRIEETLCRLANLTPADRDYADLQEMRAQVARVYSTGPATRTAVVTR
ncbi:hypothetical protein JOF56_001929 [Kibdelosporangium banguiense]|uniref:Uncharacterized protein n=1 Tax=Kibdelosporangium banguiense TaxID=1365924 RepID=A0ABS4TB27_9PSEU|nr:hypothetical protein [Kibdelosporangium banguiense]MBP2321544.1 hypothetical protein [Kibdelosporangium banguiense]